MGSGMTEKAADRLSHRHTVTPSCRAYPSMVFWGHVGRGAQPSAINLPIVSWDSWGSCRGLVHSRRPIGFFSRIKSCLTYRRISLRPASHPSNIANQLDTIREVSSCLSVQRSEQFSGPKLINERARARDRLFKQLAKTMFAKRL